MRLSKKIAFGFAAVVIIVAGVIRYMFVVAAIEPPLLKGNLQRHAFSFDGRDRAFFFYLPAQLKRGAPVVLVLHGLRGTGDRIRQATAYAFDALADQHGFIAVYPDAYEKYWNDCRATGDFAARQLGVDDTGYIRSLLAFLQKQHGIDPRGVFAVGYSDGGQMSFRLAVETPEFIRGAAAIGASMPAHRNLACKPAGKAVAVMLINGTDDPVNPFNGGEVAWPDRFGHRGWVESSLETAEYWAGLAGYEGEPFQHRYPDSVPEDGSVATRIVWTDPGQPEISLITVHGGGHTIPHPEKRFPRFLGSTNRDFSAADEIWRFFQRELDRKE
jgi:polyhydroxybutyrate depolymerase